MVPARALYDVPTQLALSVGAPGSSVWNDEAGHRPLGVMVLGLAYRTGVPWNESFYSNKKFDELLGKAEGTLDVEQRRAIMAELETSRQEEGPIAQPLWRAVPQPFHRGAREKLVSRLQRRVQPVSALSTG